MMPEKDLPDPAYLRQRLRYEPETGKLYWRENASLPNCWRARYVGCEAGSRRSDGYVRLSVDGVRYLAHRVAWAVAHGSWPDTQLDHVNGDTSDNRLVNLRQVSNTENSQNAARSRANTSGSTGVCWVQSRRKWQAVIMVNRTSHFLGYFKSQEAAIKARKRAEAAYGFHPNHGRATPA